MQFGVFSVGDVTPDPTTGRTPTEHERIEAMVAIGRPGDPAELPEDLQAREKPSGRRPVEDSIREGAFAFPR